MQLFFDSIFFSYAQIFFSNRRWFGALVLIASFINPSIGLMSLFGVVLSNTIAHLLKFDELKIKNGFYGFNGILFGAASVYYFELSIFLLFLIPVFIIITFLISTMLEHYLASAFNLPGLSLPFIIALYIFIVFLSNYDFIKSSHRTIVDEKLVNFLPNYLKTFFKSFALIICQPSIIAGIILSISVLLFSRVLFLLSIISFTLSNFLLSIILPQFENNLLIIAGLNSILTAFALGGSLIIPSRKSFILVLISTLMIIIFIGFFNKILSNTLFPILVLPFNFVALSTIYSLKFRKEQTDLVLLYFTPGSPEENYYFHNIKKSRFDKFKHFFAELPFFGEWFVSQGINGDYTHKENWKYALDFVVCDNSKSQFSNKGNELSDYYCFKLPIAAALDGEVVKVVDSIPNNEVGNVNLEKNWGNTVIIQHSDTLYSSLSHLEPNSIKVKLGDKVKQGDIIAQCGNSGRSPYPHLHFQFQASDKLGDKTLYYPIANYYVKNNNSFVFNSFNYPKENETVINIETHKTLKQVFDFKLGDKLKFECVYKNDAWIEVWEVKVDIFNNLYIESSSNAVAYIYPTKKVFYFSSFVGNRNSALHYFYLLTIKVPLGYVQNLCWSDEYSIAQFPGFGIRYISELLLLYKNFIQANASIKFKEVDEYSSFIKIENQINIKGSSIFSFYKKNLLGNLIIGQGENIKEFYFEENNNKIFSAKFIYEKD